MKTIEFEIKENIKKAKYLEENGERILTMKGEILEEGMDYRIEKIDYSGVGIEKLVINGIGDYVGQKGILIDKMNV